MIGLNLKAGLWIVASAAVLALGSPALAQRPGKSVAWSPSREAAEIVGEEPAIGTGVSRAQAFADELSAGRRPTSTAQRPARLSTRDVGRMHTEYVDGPSVVEHLPTPTHTYGGDPHLMPGHPGDGYGHGPAGPGCDSCGGAGCDSCCTDCCGNWNSCGPVAPCCLLPCMSLQNLQVLGGMQGFTGPLNRGSTGSFGFYEGFNQSMPLPCGCLCGQVGAQWTQSNLDGSFFTPEERQQTFLTAGVFRRVDWGLQGGLVFDYLHDEWDYQLDLGQLRGEIGWRTDPCNEFGFWFTASVNDDSTGLRQLVDIGNGLTRIVNRQTTVEVNDLYAFYFRRYFACGGEGRLYGGFTGNNQGLFGGDALVPLGPCWSLQANALYVTSSHRDQFNERGFLDETWNVSVGLVWTPFASPNGCCPNYCRPLFNVAGNGTFATRLTEVAVVPQ